MQGNVTREQIVTEARTWIGVKWRHQGRSRYGIDCAGLAIKVAHALGLSNFDYTGYDRRAYAHEFLKIFQENMIEKSLSKRLPGDVLIFRTRTEPHHAGILSKKRGQAHIIHASPARRSTVEEPMGFNEDYVVACFEFPGVID